MAWGARLAITFALAVVAPACSLVLDFSDSQIPIDAAPDAPFTEAQCNYKEPNDTVATAQVITPDEVGPAAICEADPQDTDFYKFTVPPSTASVQIRITFTLAPRGDLDLKLLDATGTVLSSSLGFLDRETITCPGASPPCAMLAAGDYVFQVLPGTQNATNAYDIALALTPM